MQQMVAIRAFMALRITEDLASAKRERETSAMSRELVNGICRQLNGAEWSDPWGGGHDCWKLGGKIFALTGVSTETVSVKTASPEMAEMLIDIGIGQRPKYLHRSWVALSLDSAPDELSDRIRASYDLIYAALPKKTKAALAQKDG